MAAAKIPFISPEAYLAGERTEAFKSEYMAGDVYAMAGATPEHSAIATDTRRVLGNRLQTLPRSCEVYDSDLKVRIADAGPFFYPDASVVCEEPEFDSDDCLRNPLAILEVLSESTASYDRGAKFFHYRRLASLWHYVLIEQGRMLVEHYERQENGWTLVGEHTDPNDHLTLTLSGVSVAVALSEIYRLVLFPTD